MNTLMTSDHLLVIDPCPDTQARIAEQLQGRGFSVVAVSDPTTALTTIDIAAPDILITDLFLPEATGLTLLKELKARHELCPVIVMAKDAPDHMIVQALRIGAADYLHKPVTEEELAHALQRARNLLPVDFVDIPGLCRSEYRLTVNSEPTHIPRVISWLVKTTGSTLPPIRRLHLRGALQELLFNAIEHGNLEIHYKEKQQALAEGQYDQLLAHKLAQARLRDRQVIIHVLTKSMATVYRTGSPMKERASSGEACSCDPRRSLSLKRAGEEFFWLDRSSPV
jgi:two-component system cell cycle response regulator